MGFEMSHKAGIPRFECIYDRACRSSMLMSWACNFVVWHVVQAMERCHTRRVHH